MHHYTIFIRWRGYRWTLLAKARCSVDLVLGMLDHFPPAARVSVVPDNDYANAMIKRDQITPTWLRHAREGARA